MKIKDYLWIFFIGAIFLVSSCRDVKENVKLRISEKHIFDADDYCSDLNDKNRTECYQCLADELFNRKWYRSAAIFYEKAGNKTLQELCFQKIKEELQLIENGKHFDSILSVPQGCCITNELFIISNNLNHQAGSFYLLSDSIFCFHENISGLKKIIPIDKYGVLLGVIENSLYEFNSITQKVKRSFIAHSAPITDLCMLPDSNSFVSSSWDNTIKQWNNKTFDSISTFPGHKACVTCISAGNTGEVFVSGSWDHQIKIWSYKSGNCIKTIDAKNPVMDVEMSYDSKVIFSISHGNDIYVWNANSGFQSNILTGHKNVVKVIELSDDGKFLLSGDFDGIIRIWNTRTLKTIRTFQAHNSLVTGISIAPNSQFFVSTGMDHKICFWWLAEKEAAITQLTNSFNN